MNSFKSKTRTCNRSSLFMPKKSAASLFSAAFKTFKLCKEDNVSGRVCTLLCSSKSDVRLVRVPMQSGIADNEL